MSRPLRHHTSHSESHATRGATPESSLDVTQSLTAGALGHRRTSAAAQDAQMKKTKSLDHQLSSGSEAKDHGSIEQVDYELDSRETLGAQDSIRSVDTGNGHVTGGHVTCHVTESYVKAVLEEPNMPSSGHVTDHMRLRKNSYDQAMLAVYPQDRVSSDDGGGVAIGMENGDPEMGMRRYKHDTELLPVCKT